MAELTNAAEMANAAGIDPETFREALRGSDFAWHKPPDDWTVVIDSPQHASMRTVMLIILLTQKKKNRSPTEQSVSACTRR